MVRSVTESEVPASLTLALDEVIEVRIQRDTDTIDVLVLLALRTVVGVVVHRFPLRARTRSLPDSARRGGACSPVERGLAISKSNAGKSLNIGAPRDFHTFRP